MSFQAIWRTVGHCDRRCVTEGNTRILRLPAWHLAVEFGVAKQCCSVALLVYLGGRALGVQALSAHETARQQSASASPDRAAAVEVVTAERDRRFVLSTFRLSAATHDPGVNHDGAAEQHQ